MIGSSNEIELFKDSGSAVDMKQFLKKRCSRKLKSLEQSQSSFASPLLVKRVKCDESVYSADGNSTNKSQVLTKASLDSSQLLSSQEFSCISSEILTIQESEPQLIKNSSGNILIQSMQTAASSNPTLGDIVSDAKSGFPSLQEEKARQSKILQQRQLKRNKKNTTGSLNSLESQDDLTSDPCTMKDLDNQDEISDHGEDGIVTSKSTKPVVVMRQLGGARISSNAYTDKPSQTRKWTEAETNKFIKALRIFGTDFSLVHQLFPTRTRIQIKNKFRKEEKDNFHVIEESLNMYSQSRYVKTFSWIDQQKAKLPAITSESSLEERVEILLNERKRRMNSFDSVDIIDIQLAEEVSEISKKGAHLLSIIS